MERKGVLLKIVETMFPGRAKAKALDAEYQRAKEDLKNKTQELGKAAEEALAAIAAKVDADEKERYAAESKASKKGEK